MRKPMTEEHKRKIAEARKKKNEERVSKSWIIFPCPKFGIYQLDENNYVISETLDSDRKFYYPTLEEAMSGLLKYGIQTKMAKGIQDILKSIDSARNDILKVFKK